MNHSTTQTCPGPALLLLSILDILCIVLIERRKFSWLLDRNDTHVEVYHHGSKLSVREVSYLEHHLAVNFIVLNVFVDQVNVILRLELTKTVIVRFR